MKNLHVITAALLALIAFFTAACGPRESQKEDYPNKTITLICPWAAGGGTDRLSRFMADQLQQSLGQPCVVVNRTGGSGAVGHMAGKIANPDGYTITMATFELSTMHWMGISELTWMDYEPLLQLNADAAALIVRADSPGNSLDDFLEAVRKNPGTITMSGTATGGAWDLARAGFQLAADLPVEAIRWIPTKGSGPSIVELLGGHIDSVCCSVPEAIAQIEAGQLKTLAVMSSSRLDNYPDIPTLKEQGVDWVAVGWRGLVMPKGTPLVIMKKVEDACRKIAASPAFRSFMDKNGFTVEIRTGEDFTSFLKQQDEQWRSVIESAGYARQ